MKADYKIEVHTAGAAILTLAELKAFARVESEMIADDDIFARLEKAARSYIEGRARCVLSATVFNYYALNPDQDNRIYLPRFPVTGITHFKMRTASDGSQTTLVEGTDYRSAIIGHSPYLEPINAGWPSYSGTGNIRFDHIEVRFTAGFTSTTRPVEIEQAALSLVNFWYENRGDANRPIPQFINDLIDSAQSGM